MEKRAQGRPCRGVTEVGRQRIIEGVRQHLRSGICVDYSRKSLALAIGVTPALITYYFPRKEDLMEEVTAPVVHFYANGLERLAREEVAPEVRLRRMIKLLADLYGKDGKILEIYKATRVNGLPSDEDEVQRMTETLSDFFFQWRGDECSKSFDAAVLQGAVRAMCELSANISSKLEPPETACLREAESTKWLEPLHRLFTSGFNMLDSVRSVEVGVLAAS